MLSLGTIELSWHLITEAQARIHDSDGGGDIMVKVGSNIELNCTVHSGDRVHHSLAVFWYLDGKVIDWMGQTGNGKGVQVMPNTLENDVYKSKYIASIHPSLLCQPKLLETWTIAI